MSNETRATPILGWLITLFYVAQSWVAINMPRVEKTAPLREELRSWHYLVGLVLFVLLVMRLARWVRERPPPPATGMTATGHRWARALALTFYGVLVLMPVFGIVQAWTDGLVVRLGPFVELPPLIAASRAAWMFSGYVHSALGFATLILTLVGVVTLAWFWVRRGVGPFRAFPPGFGAQLWLVQAINLYAASTFKEPGNPVPAVGGFIALSVVLWLLGAWLKGRRTVSWSARPASAIAGAIGVLGLLAILGFAALGPYKMFRLTPWPVGEVLAAPAGVTSHEAPVTTVTVAPETGFERQVRAETYKWCRFCHTVAKNDKHLAGPNLYAIFGQRAATAPNFYYSKAMAKAGREGLVWDDATLDAFLAGPDRFMPGTSMAISIGPITDPATRAAVINILKRETMPGATTP
jgi:cytochrome c2/cytochrome b561